MKWRFRFSLRVLLVLFTIVAVFCGGAAHLVYREKEKVRRHKAAKAKLESILGHEFGHASDWPDAYTDHSALAKFARKWIDPDAYVGEWSIHFGDCLSPERAREVLTIAQDLFSMGELSLDLQRLDSRTVDLINGVNGVQDLHLECVQIDEAASARLGELTKLSSIKICEPLSDAAAAELSRLPHVNHLEVDLSALSQDGASYLSKIKPPPHCTLGISLLGDSPTPEVMRALAANPDSMQLRFYGISLEDAALAELDQAGEIGGIFVSDCKLPTSFCRRIASMPALTRLTISDHVGLPETVKLSDLAASRSLKELELRISDGAGAQLEGFRAPVTLTALRVRGPIRLPAVKTILSSAPNCEIDAEGISLEFRIDCGTRYRIHEGEIQSYDYREHNGMNLNLNSTSPFGPPPWKAVSDCGESG